MLVYPNIDPIAISFGFISIRWYSIMYILAFLLGQWFVKKQIAFYLKNNHPVYRVFSEKRTSDFVFYIFIAAVIGGRVGEMLFYQLDGLLQNPLSLFEVWKGGMSHHGGLILVLIVIFLTAKRFKINILHVGDLLVLPFTMSAFLVRFGNFINNELWGKATDVPWGVLVEWQGEVVARHPTQLYQSFTGLILFFFLAWVITRKWCFTGLPSMLFLLLLGLGRFVIEFFKQHHANYDQLSGWFSTGHLLSLLVIACGLFIGFLTYQFHKK